VVNAFVPSLPIDAALPEITGTLARRTVAVLVAPPGAGKTTRVPLVLIGEPWAAEKKILVLEPRRLATRAAAERMAKTLGERVGDTVGYRVRFGSKVSRRTRIEVVTEGVFTRLVLDDPSLDGIAAVLFDEFHERSLDGDLGLALTRDAQQGLREDLRMLVMSATIDGARIASALGDAPVITSEGRAFAVETRYLGRDPAKPIDAQVADAILRALRGDTGSILAFLPGAAEIRRTETRLREAVADPAVDIHPLFGALAADAQDHAIAPAPPGRRKVVLATSIAETSLTIDGVRVVIDSGLARVPRYEPDVGLTRLETVRVSRAAADQRRGRAGRIEPGVCYRLWEEPQTAALEAYGQPEILAADLSSLVLDLAQWGIADPSQLVFLDPPPAAALAEARTLLADLGAIDAAGRITAEGKVLNRLPLPPRLARMVLDAGREGVGRIAAEIAAVLSERGLGGNDVDLRHRLDGLRRDRTSRAEEARRMAKRWAESAQSALPALRAPHDVGGAAPSVGAILALAYPERLARNRGGVAGAFLLANGRGANIDPASPLAREPFLAVAEIIGSAAQGRITLAAAMSLADIEARFSDRIEAGEEVSVDRSTLALRCRRSRRLGAITLGEQPMPAVASEATATLLAKGVAAAGLDRLPWTKALQQWRDRVMFLRAAEGDEWPDLSDAALADSASDWLAPLFADKTALAAITTAELDSALQNLLPYALRRRLEAEAPTHFDAPSGSRVPIEYHPDGPKLAIRVQELFGLDHHPSIARGRVPLVIELLSPAHRPVQVTRDLPNFWRGSYAAVRADLRGRYPRHPWPEDPLSAPATRRAKPRGQ
jgi:ATP-dependent helicase HrpB